MQEVPRIEAIDRALRLLLALSAAGPAGATLAELARGAEVNKSTAYRALATLRARYFVTQSFDDGTYQLGPAAMALGAGFLTPENVAQVLRPALVAVSRAADELVHLGVMVEDHVLYIDKVEPARSIRVWSSVGQRVPVATTALGRAILAGRDVQGSQLELYVRLLGEGHPLTLNHLRAVVRQAQRRGYSTELEENEAGVACLGTAIMRGEEVVAALSITAPAERMTVRRQAELAELIRREVPPLLPESWSLMPRTG